MTSLLSPHRHEVCLTPTLQQLLLDLKIVIMASLGLLSSTRSFRIEFGSKTSVADVQGVEITQYLQQAPPVHPC